MRFTTLITAAVGLFLSSTVAQRVCNNCTNASNEPYVLAPAPWDLQAETAYLVPMIGLSRHLPDKAFSPLERNSSYESSGTFLAGTGLLMIIRYKDSPVGPYDEFIILPGLWTSNGDNGLVPQVNFRISRIYVSHKYTTWNGRRNWNIPKHLARFDWTTNADGSESVQIYPHDTTTPLDETSGPSKKAFFQATFKKPLLGDLVQLPLSTAILQVLGGLNLDPLTIGSPPLPKGNGVYDELQGTDHWANTEFGLKSGLASVGVMDISQGPQGDQVGNTGRNAVGDEYYPNFWPGMPRINAAVRIKNGVVSFSAPKTYN